MSVKLGFIFIFLIFLLVKHRQIQPNIIQIIRLRIGHAITPEYLYRIGFRNDPFCDCGSDEVGDINHYYLGCSNKKVKIDRFLKSSKLILQLPINMEIILYKMLVNPRFLSNWSLNLYLVLKKL